MSTTTKEIDFTVKTNAVIRVYVEKKHDNLRHSIITADTKEDAIRRFNNNWASEDYIITKITKEETEILVSIE